MSNYIHYSFDVYRDGPFLIQSGLYIIIKARHPHSLGIRSRSKNTTNKQTHKQTNKQRNKRVGYVKVSHLTPGNNWLPRQLIPTPIDSRDNWLRRQLTPDRWEKCFIYFTKLLYFRCRGNYYIQLTYEKTRTARRMRRNTKRLGIRTLIRTVTWTDVLLPNGSTLRNDKLTLTFHSDTDTWRE